jgi:hypothetical protein
MPPLFQRPFHAMVLNQNSSYCISIYIAAFWFMTLGSLVGSYKYSAGKYCTSTQSTYSKECIRHSSIHSFVFLLHTECLEVIQDIRAIYRVWQANCLFHMAHCIQKRQLACHRTLYKDTAYPRALTAWIWRKSAPIRALLEDAITGADVWTEHLSCHFRWSEPSH